MLKAITLYVWGFDSITNATDMPVVWAQSLTAINPLATVSVTPTSIDLGYAPVPEPSTVLLLFVLGTVCLFGYAIARVFGSLLER